jgi:hypothetical protein
MSDWITVAKVGEIEDGGHRLSRQESGVSVSFLNFLAPWRLGGSILILILSASLRFIFI